MSNEPIHTAYLLSLLKETDSVIIFVSPDSVIQELSAQTQKYFLWDLNKIRSKTIESLYQDGTFVMPFPYCDLLKIRDDGDVIETIINYKGRKKYFSWSAVVISPHAGYMLQGVDVTDKKKVAINRRKLYTQLENISVCVPGNFYWKNTHGEYLGCNDTLVKTLGFNSMQDIIGKTDEDLWPTEAESLRENDQQVITSGETLFLEEKVTMPGQADRYFTATKMPLLDEDGTTIGVLGNSLDITDMKNVQTKLQIAIEQAEVANRVKSEFIANMGHD
ncbi:MAG: PAS domain-containing protein, partial [Legionella sp.]